MNPTNIEWVKSPDGSKGMSWNPITGCLNGCEYCYARRLANGRLRFRYLANKEVAESGGKYSWERKIFDPFYPRFWPEKIDNYSLTNSWRCEPKGIFVCDMSDLFGIGVPEEWTRRILDKISHGEHKLHRFYLLTKQPQNLQKFSPFPDNCWVGVSATSDLPYVEAFALLSNVQAKVKYISFEPLLGRISDTGAFMKAAGISWVIIGAQTKPTVMPKIEWVKEIISACDKAGIPVFLKDNLRELIREAMWPKWSMDIKGDLRQEMPKILCEQDR